MNIVIIHGQNHKGNTCMVARKLAQKIEKRAKTESTIREFFLPEDFNEPCLGCYCCFQNNLTKCPHFTKLQPISDAILAADLLILASPVYVYHATGQMMNLLDHFGTWWMVHRPRTEMCQKQAVVISTAAGGGMKSTCKDMADSLEMWGIHHVYRLGIGVQAAKPVEIPGKVHAKIELQTDKLADKIIAGNGKCGMNARGKRWFYLIRFAHKCFPPSEPDYGYWEKKGWHKNSRPWKQK